MSSDDTAPPSVKIGKIELSVRHDPDGADAFASSLSAAMKRGRALPPPESWGFQPNPDVIRVTRKGLQAACNRAGMRGLMVGIGAGSLLGLLAGWAIW